MEGEWDVIEDEDVMEDDRVPVKVTVRTTAEGIILRQKRLRGDDNEPREGEPGFEELKRARIAAQEAVERVLRHNREQREAIAQNIANVVDDDGRPVPHRDVWDVMAHTNTVQWREVTTDDMTRRGH